MTRKSGFTLIELLVGLVLLGIIAAISVPGFSSWLPNYRLRSASRHMVSTLQLARIKAVKENATVAIVFNTASNSYEAFVDNGEGGGTADDWIRNGQETLLMERTIPKDVDMYESSFSLGAQVRFNGQGFIDGLGGHIYLKNTRDRYMGVTLNRVGNPTVVESTDGVTWN
jgi:type IV fimbrial biogenesis protein FimT